jgi:2-dehydropantoate 2-reductase
MRVCVVGAGALGASFGARLAAGGHEVTLVDAWREHVEAIRRHGLRADGEPRVGLVRVEARLPEEVEGGHDVALIAVDANGTREAAVTAGRALGAGGFAATLQNGIGNVEALCDALGRERVVGGSTMCSFRTVGPGHVEQTHAGPTTIGEPGGGVTERVGRLADALRGAGYEVAVSDDIMGVIWAKFVLNLAINPVCAVTGLRLGEVARLDATDRFQDRLLEEAFAVARAKGLGLDEAALRERVKAQCWAKFSEPSMLQHIRAGRRTEIDALNGALVREAQDLGVPVPFNEALTLLVKGRELHERRRVGEPGIDYAALEAAAREEARPAARA